MKKNLILVTILIMAIVVGGSTYYFTSTRAQKEKQELEDQIKTLKKSLPKSYDNKELGFSFQYPSNWETINFNKITKLLISGDYYSANQIQQPNGIDIKYVDFEPSKSTYFRVDSKDLEGFYFGKIVNRQVDSSWTKDEFTKNVPLSLNKILAYKKFGKNSIMTVQSGGYECSPSLNIVFYTPLSNEQYPNFVTTLDLEYYTKNDPVIAAYSTKLEQNNETVCDLTEPGKIIADKIVSNDYSQELSSQVNTIQTILNSIASI